jgi:hypothetical protein
MEWICGEDITEKRIATRTFQKLINDAKRQIVNMPDGQRIGDWPFRCRQAG